MYLHVHIKAFFSPEGLKCMAIDSDYIMQLGGLPAVTEGSMSSPLCRVGVFFAPFFAALLNTFN